jgi:RNA recognition motif-containing protein
LPHNTTEAELREFFQPHGDVQKVSIVTDRDTGRSRGFAFIEMTDSGSADKAIAALNGTQLGGRALTINEAKPKTERSGGGGRPVGKPRFGGGGRGRDDYQGHARQPREPRW